MMYKKLVIFLSIVVATICIAWIFAWPYPIAGDCMEPAVKDGSWVFLNRALPYIRQYRHGDIIVFEHEGKAWISRVVGLANETIRIDEKMIIVNGTPLEDKVQRNWTNWKQGSYAIEKSYTIPNEHLYVLSDDLPANHDDSRVFGTIQKKSVLGMIW